jgi:dihydroflavonol-4-reductase
MKILLLGATGQIGYALAMALARTEHQLSVVVRDASGLHFPDAVTLIEQPEFTLDVFRAALHDADHVIYGIGLPEQFLFDNSVFEKVNYDLFATFLEAMQNSRVRRLTYISTYEVFEVIDGVIDETHPIADESRMTPYSQSKVRAYRLAVDFARTSALQLTTIHPAAVYGGLNTGDGITDYMENLLWRKWYRAPFIYAGNFPVIHVDSLTDVIIKSLDMPGAYIASDEMTTLQCIAQAMRRQAGSYIPAVMPLGLVTLGVSVLEALAKVIRIKPLASAVQIDFITKGWMPNPAKAIRELCWKPMTLDEGIRRFLSKKVFSDRGELNMQPKEGPKASSGYGLAR